MDCVFYTERLCFRVWKEDDLAEFCKMNSDPAVMEYFTGILTENESRRMLERIKNAMDKKGYGLWAVETKCEQRFIGFIGFNDTVFESSFTPCVEIGWRLKKEAWVNGFASEGAKACLEYGFNVLGLKEIYSFTSIFNKRSERVMIKTGLKKTGEFDHPQIEEGNRLRKHVLCRLTYAEFKAQFSA